MASSCRTPSSALTTSGHGSDSHGADPVLLAQMLEMGVSRNIAIRVGNTNFINIVISLLIKIEFDFVKYIPFYCCLFSVAFFQHVATYITY